MYKLSDMKIRIKTTVFFSVLLLAGAMVSCDTDVENLQIQKPYTYSEQYYQNLRDYKNSDHSISFMWFADYSNEHSMGFSFLGLPDSLDICSLWGPPGGAIPSDVKGKFNTFYHPTVYNEMRFVQKVKGTKITYVEIPGNGGWPEGVVSKNPTPEEIDKNIVIMGDYYLKLIYDNDLDGVDLDYEIAGTWLHRAPFSKLIAYLGQHIGPKGKDPSKLLIVDGYPMENGGYEYINYFISQAYYCPGADNLQKRYNEVAKELEPHRFIVTEDIGEGYATGGWPFTEADGNTVSGLGGRLHSTEGMARWNPTQGRKGGFGSFYGHRDYMSTPPYKWFKYGIQIQNPAVK